MWRTLDPTVPTAAPLVQCLTNSVTTNFVANALLAVGASPAMVDVPGEAGPFAQVAHAVLVNLGTPGAEQSTAIREAVAAAHRHGTPWVLDPVAVGALDLRTALAHDLLACAPTAIRGNASEIRALAGERSSGRGVDAGDDSTQAVAAALHLARRTGAVVAVSGAVDVVTNGTHVAHLANGTTTFARITGAGCALGGVVAAWLGQPGADPWESVIDACTGYAVAGEVAEESAAVHGPGTFAPAFLDALATLEPSVVAARARVSEVVA